ncbi:2'-5' RNA ligase family protein [Aurantimonas sp. MSK8Z-1]|nr:2'-5' RNA ligase family protein [Aurantimonas sp. MSK8Z-1]
MDDSAPLIMTLALDEASLTRFEAVRRRLFPPERNRVPAHLTLFHKLPGAARATVVSVLYASAEQTLPFDVDVTGVRFIGRGNAFALDSPRLLDLRLRLAQRFAEWLTPQDRQPFQPHVTVQNKVDAGRARQDHAELCAAFSPWTSRAIGLDLWHYRGGPWERAASFSFGGG